MTADLHQLLAVRLNKPDLSRLRHETTDHGIIYRFIHDDNPRVASNALWYLTLLDRESAAFLAEKRWELAELAMTTQSETIRRLSLGLLKDMTWTQEDVRTDLLDFCLSRAVSAIEKPGIRSLAIKLAYLLCRHYPELAAELRMVLTDLGDQPLTRAVDSIRISTLRRLR